MPVPSKHSTVAVNGASGFLGGWTVRLLLDKGYRVRACVRDTGDLDKTGFLRGFPGFASGRLTLHSADLSDATAYDGVLEGCEAFFHIAHLGNYNDAEYVDRVNRQLIDSINNSKTIRRVAVTSSIAAVLDEDDLTELRHRPVLDEDRYPDKSNPNQIFGKRHGYSMGKIMMEQLFADAAASNGSWDAITVCPGDILGPILSAHQAKLGPWQFFVGGMLGGYLQQSMNYRPWMPVDVRDCAASHIGLMESSLVNHSERYIAWSTETRTVEDICSSIARILPELNHLSPELTDKQPEAIQSRETELRDIWSGCVLKNDRIRAVTDVSFRSLDDTLRDCIESLLSLTDLPVNT